MFMKDENNKCCSLYCKCGCDDGVVLKAEKDEEFGYELMLVTDSYYAMQNKRTLSFKEKIKRILKILRNEEYCYFSIYMDDKELEEFKDFIAKMQ